jgi:hypothetical protein
MPLAADPRIELDGALASCRLRAASFDRGCACVCGDAAAGGVPCAGPGYIAS